MLSSTSGQCSSCIALSCKRMLHTYYCLQQQSYRQHCFLRTLLILLTAVTAQATNRVAVVATVARAVAGTLLTV
jgi:hypothetical protein